MDKVAGHEFEPHRAQNVNLLIGKSSLYHVLLTTHMLVLSTAENVLTAFHLVSIPF